MASSETTTLRNAAMQLSIGRRLAMVLLGYIPLLHVTGVASLIVLPAGGFAPWWLIWTAPAALYLAPPLVVRAANLFFPLEDGRYGLESPQFIRWWFTAQWQVVFNRLPMLEELLRLVPSLYSLWMRLWGARIGGLVYWSPGCIVLDRPLVDIGSRTVIGAGARIHAHMIMKPAGSSAASLVVARVRIGDDALVAGLSLVLPGVRVHDGEQTRGFRPAAPFSEFVGGRCIRHKSWLDEDEADSEKAT